MILYCVALPVFLCHAIVHKISKHNKEDVVLLIDKRNYQNRGLVDVVKELETKGIFTNVYLDNLFMRRVGSKEKLISNCVSQFDQVFVNMGYDSTDFDKIYVMNDNWDGDLNLYFNINKIKYTWIETAENTLLEGMPFQFEREFASLVNEYKSLTPFATYATAEILQTSNESKERLLNQEYSSWDFKEAIKEIPSDEFLKIVECYGIADAEMTENSSLLVVNSFGYACNCEGGIEKLSDEQKWLLGVNDYDMQEIFSVIDCIAMDYYSMKSDVVFLKPHPHDPINKEKLETLYGEKWKLLSNAPFEFIQKYLYENKIHFNTIVGYASTSLSILNKDFCNNLFLLGNDYFRTWHYYDSIYVSLLLAKNHAYSVIYTYPHIRSQMENMLRITEMSGYEVEFREVSNLRKLLEIKNAIVVLDCQLVDLKTLAFIEDMDESSSICFVNLDCEKQFFEEKMRYAFVPIKLQKSYFEPKYVDICRNEVVWLFTMNKKTRIDSRKFEYQRNMKHTGIQINVNKISLSECQTFFNESNQKLIKKDLMELRDTNVKAFEIINCIDNPRMLSSIMRKEYNPIIYFELLKLLQSRYMIIVSVKDTPGNLLPKSLISNLHNIGFRAFSSGLWMMYVGIRYKNAVLYDVSSDKAEETVYYKGDINGLMVKITSKSWRNGNIAEICIDDIDYSTNIRGVNVVIYDIENKNIIDSVGLDAHDDKFMFVHKELI